MRMAASSGRRPPGCDRSTRAPPWVASHCDACRSTYLTLASRLRRHDNVVHLRHRRRRPRRRQGCRSIARQGFRRSRRVVRRRGTSALRASAAVQGIPGRQEGTRRLHRRLIGLVSRPPRRAAARHRGVGDRSAAPTPFRCPTAAPCTTTSCCWPPVRSRAGRRSPAPTPTACTTCAPSTTPTR